MKEAKKFEQAWQERLGEAEVTPPEHIWGAIDAQLAKGELSKAKKRIIFYKWIAAACIALTAGLGIFQLGNRIESDGETISQNSSSEETKRENLAHLNNHEQSETTLRTNNILSTSRDNSSQEKIDGSDSNTRAVIPFHKKRIASPSSDASNARTLLSNIQENSESASDIQFNKEKSELLIKRVAAKRLEHYSLTKSQMPDRLNAVAYHHKGEEKTNDYDNLYAGISLLAGGFDPNFGFGSADMAGDVASPVLFSEQESVTSSSEPSFGTGSTVSGGIDVGKRLTKRFLISSGIRYSSFSTGSGDQTVFIATEQERFITTNDFSELDVETANEVVQEYSRETTTLSNEYEYITIPIKAGIILIDRKFNVVLNTGIASNFLVNARIQAEDINESVDDSDRYEKVYTNLLSSLALGYNWREHYQLSIEPEYGFAINDFTNSNHNSRGRPALYGLSVGFRYNF